MTGGNEYVEYVEQGKKEGDDEDGHPTRKFKTAGWKLAKVATFIQVRQCPISPGEACPQHLAIAIPCHRRFRVAARCEIASSMAKLPWRCTCTRSTKWMTRKRKRTTR